MKQMKKVIYVLMMAFSLLGMSQAQAQQWLSANGNFYTLSTVKVGLGTTSPVRNFEINHATDNFIRINSIGGNAIESQRSGLELRRSLLNGTSRIWSVENEGDFKIKQNATTFFSIAPTIAWLGQNNDNPIEFAIYGKSINQTDGGSITGGGLRLQSKVGTTLHVLRIDGNQLESNGEFYLNNLSNDHISLVQGGGKVKIGTTDSEARLGISSSDDFQLKLMNTGNQGGAWRIGVANSTWASGQGKLVFSKTASSSDATMVLTPAGNVGIGLTTPSRTLHVNGTIRTKILEITGGADLAEPFNITNENTIQPGYVVSIDPENAGNLRLSQNAYDKTVAGIVSGAGDIQPGMVMGQDGTIANGQHPVALTGRVYCQVDASYGAIRPGDLLTTSNMSGHAMKVSNHKQAQGAIIGKAMTSLESGKGLVLVLVSLQ
jgi:hypothetical protein